MRVHLVVSEVSVFATQGMLIIAREPDSWILYPMLCRFDSGIFNI